MPAHVEITQDQLNTILDAIVSGESICQVLDALGISRATFYRRRLDTPEFETTIARAQELAQEANVDRTEQLAMTATVENWQLVQFQCRNMQWVAGKRKPKKYGDNAKIALTGEDGGPIQIVSTIPRPERT